VIPPARHGQRLIPRASRTSRRKPSQAPVNPRLTPPRPKAPRPTCHAAGRGLESRRSRKVVPIASVVDGVGRNPIRAARRTARPPRPDRGVDRQDSPLLHGRSRHDRSRLWERPPRSLLRTAEAELAPGRARIRAEGGTADTRLSRHLPHRRRRPRHDRGLASRSRCLGRGGAGREDRRPRADHVVLLSRSRREPRRAGDLSKA
jgi:hypothetical protein